MKTVTRSKFLVYLFHILFWLCYGAILYASLSNWIDSPAAVWKAVISDVVISSAISYANLLWLLPKLYRRGKYSLYIIAAITLMLLLVLLRVYFLGISHRSVTYTYFIRSVPVVGFYLITTVIWFFTTMIAAQQREIELRNNQLNSELKFLKLQLSPHFLFNTLNNIYSMAYFKDSNTAPAIMKLSGLMRHMLHDDQGRFISLSKEIDFMENFISLWRLKLDEKPNIVFEHEGVHEGHRIAHLIFLVFLENAFKHGNTMNGNIQIKLNVTKEDILHFYLKNDILEVRNTLEEKSGVGLANVKKRLELIYPHKHTLRLNRESDYFEVHVTIDLK
ncbi:sensor histidine kinase [Arenibacter sp. GZD96]|uniref:sensor histidine kinase n=1 Tax=Aurantibrevibacter litoralis TaxID=3106030 RepID=UPI002AFDE030|nr:sensor histidine kinase [Arenibacter sp. GZD-96]MEA1784680.1 sensor histidine kinase [Arenibacter sp. GZD-96]